jgi:AAHS family benzoate transporter-like MFS transporter
MTTTQQAAEDQQNAKRSRTVVWVVTIATIGLIFDGYDLVVYGAVVSTFLKDPSQIGEVTPALAGTLGSYALIGTLVGALLAGSVGDIVGRRKVMLTAYAWFSIGMLFTALVSSSTLFGIMRFVTGLGVGALVATTGALVAEIAPAGKKNLCNAITYSGVPIGSLMSALLAILLLDSIGWRGMFMIGASPLLILCRWRSCGCRSRWRGWSRGDGWIRRGRCPSGQEFRCRRRQPRRRRRPSARRWASPACSAMGIGCPPSFSAS